ncbi:MAG: tyrosine-type recombinase/integrase [Spirochaetales bacterium]|nr:tyrosine-type recombinase/integrase [Spirochaetales bacterium]
MNQVSKYFGTPYKHRKNKAGKWVYYVHPFDLEGVRLPAISTGKTTKREALEWCIQQVVSGTFAHDSITFKEFTKYFWDYENCPYVTERIASGYSYSKAYVAAKRSELERHLIPEFGDMDLTKINIRKVQNYRSDLRKSKGRYNKPLSNKNINSIIGNLRTIMEEAKRLEYIPKNPLDSIKDYKVENGEKLYLPHKQVRELFKEELFQKHWKGNQKMYTMNLLSATTGLRLGECQALRVSDIDFDHYLIHITRSWGRQYNMKGPKTRNSIRFVPFPKFTEKHLKQLIKQEGKKGDQLVFSSISDPYNPVDHKTVSEHLYEAFYTVGLKESDRSERKITFQSWRHFFVSKVRPNVPEHLLRAVVGHSSKSVTDQYTHQLDLEDFDPVRKAQEKLI